MFDNPWSGFSDEWDEWKVFDLPPQGTEFDDWDDEHPSQRALVIRAIRETPDLLRWAIRGQRDWYGVVGRLLEGRDEMRARIPPRDEPEDLTPSQSTYRLKEILDIIKDS